MLGFDHRPKHIAKQFIISLDFDGVLAQSYHLKLKYIKEWFGIEPNDSQTKATGFNRLMKRLYGAGEIPKPYDYDEDFRKRLLEEHQMEFVIPPHCQEVLVKLFRQGFRFVIVTSRREYEYIPALRFVKKNYGGVIKKIHRFKQFEEPTQKETYFGNIINRLYHVRGKPKDKAIKLLRARIHVDDGLSKLLQMLNTSAELAYFRQPENRGKNVSPMHRRIFEFRDWREFYRYAIFVRDFHEAICWKHNLENIFTNVAKISAIYKDMDAEELQKLILEYRAEKLVHHEWAA
jgi:hypothetical protein